jgi:hypothetical protein
VPTYVDDLCLVMKEPLKFLQSEPYPFKPKGAGPMPFHLGCGFERDTITGILKMDPKEFLEQMIDLRNTFRYLGVPIKDTSYLFGDNVAMVQRSWMVAGGFIELHHIRLATNLADVLTKNWSHGSVYDLLRPVFHHAGNAASLYIDDRPGCMDRKVEKDEASDSILEITNTNKGKVKWNQEVQWKTF